MDNIETRLNHFQPQMLSVFRIMFGLLILQHGFSKWFGFPNPAPANIQLLTMVGIAGVIELIAGALLTVGLFTRYAAFFVAGYTAVGYWTQHFPRGWTPIGNNGSLIIAYCFAGLLLIFYGGGPWSLDAVLSKKGAISARPA
jgi:putative oxidoreductase